MSKYKQAIVLRKDLNMRKGKMIAQGAHASMAAILNLGTEKENEFSIPKDERIWEWLTGNFKKIALSVDSEQELLNLYEKALELGLVCALIKDNGLTEFGGVPTFTAVAIGPDKNEKIDQLTGSLKLL